MVVEPIRDKKQIDRFLTYLKGKNQRDWLLAKFQLNTGLRISDVVNIKAEDLFSESLKFKDYFIVKEHKTDKVKKIKLNIALKQSIMASNEIISLQMGSYIFQSRKGQNKPISVTQAYRILKDGANAVSIQNFGTHSLRKTWGYWTYKESKYNIGLIMDMFNHSSQFITLRYIGINQDQRDELYSMVQF